MFETQAGPRVFGVAPGVDFPKALLQGLKTRLAGQPPHAMAQVTLVVNTRRMARRLRMLFEAGPASFMPRVLLVTDLGALAPDAVLPPAASTLRRRLELLELVRSLTALSESTLPRTAAYDLTESLAALIAEMQVEGVNPKAVAQIDVGQHALHWGRAQKFLEIATDYAARVADQPDPEARQRRLVEDLAQAWEVKPPTAPIIVAGSTGSRGTTHHLMQAVARLPQGALVLPGYDFDMPEAAWPAEDGIPKQEDHPQYRYVALRRALGIGTAQVAEWTSTPAPSAERNALVSLALRPAPVTDSWLIEGPRLQDVAGAAAGMTLIEANSPRSEALAIAMRLRQAAEEGITAALITPDRMLTRRVTAALDRWNVLPDDSAGTPLHLSPPGRFLRHVADLFVRPLGAEALLTLLKHPLAHSGGARGPHQLYTQLLEARIRRDGLPFPTAQNLGAICTKIADQMKEPAQFEAWVSWVVRAFDVAPEPQPVPLADWTPKHQARAELIAQGFETGGAHGLWSKAAGQACLSVFDTLSAEAAHGGDMDAREYATLFDRLLQGEEVRDRDAPHPRIMIWGTLEARVQGADLVILGGLNEGTWPEAPPPDPWLNRSMRRDLGLPSPERRIGLSAHDFQQAIAAPEVFITRSIRSDEAETVPSRWLSRLLNLLGGLPNGDGEAAVNAMRERGRAWLDRAKLFEAAPEIPSPERPAPRPPVAARPKQLSVTEIQKLIRDPYAIYARHALGLRPLDPLVQAPDAPMRGIIVHDIMERFIRETVSNPGALTAAHLLDVANAVLAEICPWPAARVSWLARLARVAEAFVDDERNRQSIAQPRAFEDDARGVLVLKDIGFTLIGKADRIDVNAAGEALIYDYKTGSPPSKKAQTHFDKQLLLEAAMAEEGAFPSIGATRVAEAAYIALGASAGASPAPTHEEPTAKILADLRQLIAAYQDQTQGFNARRAMDKDTSESDYDQLSRYGEWDATQPARPEDLA